MIRPSDILRPLLVCLAVVLVSAPALAATRNWSATPVNGNWNNISNWVEGIVPVAGDDLVFPLASTTKSLTNDLTDGISIASITFNGNGYTLAGNSISLGTTGIALTTNAAPQTNTVSLNVTVGATATLSVVNASQLSLTGTIGGAGGLTKNGAGPLILDGANTYDGITTVSAGLVSVEDVQALGDGDGTLPTGTVVASGASITVHAAIANEHLTISAEGNSIFGAMYSGSTAAWNGPIVLAADTDIGGTSGGGFAIGGAISGGFALTKVADFGVTLSGTNTYTGATTVSAGQLFVNGSIGGSGVTVNSGALLGGSGTVSTSVASQSGATVAPGLSPAILDSGNLTLAGGSTLTIELDGVTADTQYDQVNVAGAVDISGSTLNVVLGFVPPEATSFVIINNDAADAITGTFAGLTEGAAFVIAATTFTISYIGGTGNDVVLTTAAAVPTMGPWAIALLALLLAGLTLWRLRQKPAAALRQ